MFDAWRVSRVAARLGVGPLCYSINQTITRCDHQKGARQKVGLEGKQFRALSVDDRGTMLADSLKLPKQVIPSMSELDVLTENVIGKFVLGQSVIYDAKINGDYRVLPMVTEEPSVVAAVNNAIKCFNKYGGIKASNDPCNTMSGQVLILKNGIPFEKIKAQINTMENELKDELAQQVDKLHRLIGRGGGFIGGFKITDLDQTMAVVEFELDVQEAMGANIVSLVAETLGHQLKHAQHGQPFKFDTSVHILSNDASNRKAYAKVEIPMTALGNTLQNGHEVAKKIVQASRFAFLSSKRAVTHNKGTMNGVTAVALAIGQDTRAIEAAVHSYASNKGLNGKYGPITTWQIADDKLVGTIEIPTPVGVVGRTKMNKSVYYNFLTSDTTSAKDCAQLIATAGLAANFSALKALVGSGITTGHMRLHNLAEEKTK